MLTTVSAQVPSLSSGLGLCGLNRAAEKDHHTVLCFEVTNAEKSGTKQKEMIIHATPCIM
jgi:hypothetical protein